MPAGRWWAIRLGMVAEDDADAPAREEPRQAVLAVAKGESADIPTRKPRRISFRDWDLRNGHPMTDIEKFHAELTGACQPSFDRIPVADDWPSFLARIIYSRSEQVRASVLRRRGHGGIDPSSGPRTHEVAGFVFDT